MQGTPSGLQDPGVWCDTDLGRYEVDAYGDVWGWQIRPVHVTPKGNWEFSGDGETNREDAVHAAEKDYIKRVLKDFVLDWQLADSSTFVIKDQIVFKALSGAYQVFYKSNKNSWSWRKWADHLVAHVGNSHDTLKAALLEAEADHFESIDPVKELTSLNNLLVNGDLEELTRPQRWGPKERSGFNDLVNILTGKGATDAKNTRHA
jgi:hypothetical protein